MVFYANHASSNTGLTVKEKRPRAIVAFEKF